MENGYNGYSKSLALAFFLISGVLVLLLHNMVFVADIKDSLKLIELDRAVLDF